jgi:hypothetical protein
VVTSANFLIDSESKLKSAAGGMGVPGHGGHGGAPAGGKPPPQTGPEEHSQHLQIEPQQAKPQKKTTDHSGHQPWGAGDDQQNYRILRAQQIHRPPNRWDGDDGRMVLDAQHHARRHPRSFGHAGHHLLAMGSKP